VPDDSCGGGAEHASAMAAATPDGGAAPMAYADGTAAGLGAQPRDHRVGEVDPVHRHAALRERGAIRPVPTPSSSARPAPACSTRKSTVDAMTSGANSSPSDRS
jgi:hypothetical protein